jgi:hypothetical protein
LMTAASLLRPIRRRSTPRREVRPVCRIGRQISQPPIQFWVAVELGPAVVRTRSIGQFARVNNPQPRRSAADPPMQDGRPLKWNRLILRAVNEVDRNLTQEHKVRVGVSAAPPAGQKLATAVTRRPARRRWIASRSTPRPPRLTPVRNSRPRSTAGCAAR